MRRLLLWFKPKGEHEREIIRFVRKSFGIYPGNSSVYRQALRHGSAVTKGAEAYERSNERLEFLGDAVLDAIVAEYLYRKHDELSEGELTKLKSKVVSRKALNQLGEALNISELLEVRIGNQPVQQTLVGNALEALIGALYLDCGYRTTERVVLNLLRVHGLDERMYDVSDFKSKLHEYCQKRKRSLHFEVVKEKSGADDYYEMIAYVDHRQCGVGRGKSKKSAQQAAAHEACLRIFGDMK